MKNIKGHRRSAFNRKPPKKRINKRAMLYHIKKAVARQVRGMLFNPQPFNKDSAMKQISGFLKMIASRHFPSTSDYDIQISSTQNEDGSVSLRPGNLQTLIMMAGQGRENTPTLKELQGLTEWKGELGRYAIIDGAACFMPVTPVERITITGTFDKSILN